MTPAPFLTANARWLGAGGVMTFGSCIGQTFFISIFAAQIMADFGITDGQWGQLYGAGTLASGLLMIWAGGLADKFRARNLAILCLCGLAILATAMAWNRSVWAIPFIIFGLRLFGQGMLHHSALVAMSRWFVAARGRAIAVSQLGFSLGEAFLPFAFALMLTQFSWRSLWLLPVIACLVMMPLLHRLLSQERTPQSLAAQDSTTGMHGLQWNRPMALRHWLIWSLAPLIMGPSAFGTAFFFQQVHFAGTKGISHEALTALFPVYTFSTIGFALIFGAMIDRFGASRLLPYIGLPLVVGFLTLWGAAGLMGLIIGLLFMALAQGGNGTVLVAFWSEVFGTKHIGSIKAFATALMVIGSAIGPALSGILIDYGITFEAQMPAISVYFLVSTMISWAAVRAARRSLA
ncbi:MFS transporter [Algirhabdus cladophorae]|uniref:MFS transporter n=1 Tax=Algirhabdus cladophorae TaxID=3377108 RepID=UPI003B848B14